MNRHERRAEAKRDRLARANTKLRSLTGMLRLAWERVHGPA